MKTSCLTLPLVLLLFVPLVPAQNVQIITNFPPRTLAEALRSKGINDLSEPSLIAALTNSDPQVRIMAANKLAEDHHDDATPAIESALAREQDLNAQVGLAEALWSLHDEKGVAHLHAICTDPSLSFEVLISAVRALKLTHSPAGGCAETFFAAMTRVKEPGELAMGASLLPAIYVDAKPGQRTRILATLELLLADKNQEAPVRLLSSQALSDIGTPECAQAIRAAIAQEQDPTVRTFFEATLKGLEKRAN